MRPGPLFEDFQPGQALEGHGPRRVGDAEAAAYIAATGDRTRRYCGDARLVHPLVVFHTVFGQTVRSVSRNARANLGYADMIWHRPVRVGAVLHTRSEVIGLRETSSGRDGIVWVRTLGSDVDGPVLSFVRWVLVPKRDPAATPWRAAPSIPDLPPEVRPGTFEGAEDRARSRAFASYQPGERLLHSDAVTVTDSHMEFTRLFQNSARVHFDARWGPPLVYGGYVLSLGYAAMLDGFPDRLGLCAVNAGTHANPVVAGDTLTAYTDVLATDPRGDAPAGGVRCRLVVLRNEDPSSETAHVGEDGRHHPGVVLDLDLWELIPKKETSP